MEFVNVIVDISHEKLDRIFQYRIPEELQGKISTGMQVLIPFGMGNRTIKGYVTGVTDVPDYPVEKIKPVTGLVDGAVPVAIHRKTRKAPLVCFTRMMTFSRL